MFVFLAGFLFASLSLWAQAVLRVARGKPILEPEPRSMARWGLIDVLIGFIVIVGSPAIAMSVLVSAGLVRVKGEKTPEDYFVLLTTNGCSILGSFLLVWAIVAMRTHSSMVDLGLPRRSIGSDLLLGGAAYLMLAPLVFGIQLILVMVFGPTQHPLILLLQKQRDLPLFLAAGLSAVVAAPIVEEFLFRGLFQGWMESLHRGLTFEQVLFGRGDGDPPPAQHALPAADAAPAVSDNPDAAFALPEVEAPVSEPVSLTHWRNWIPITISSALFSLAHWSHGPDFVALFFLALGLGYLFQRTHRLLPCMVVHFLLNATSMALMYVQLFVIAP